MLLYDSAVSGNSYKVRLLLAHLGLSYERRELSVNDRSNRPAILGALNPALRVPTIVLDDGRPLAEVERDPLVLRRRDEVRARRSLRARAGPAMAVLRAVRPRAAHRGRALLAPLQGRRRLRPPPPSPRSRRPATARSTRWKGTSPIATSSSARATRWRTSRSTPTRTSPRKAAFEMHRYPAINRWIARVAAQPGHVKIDA
jgi:glutathione S-transferase